METAALTARKSIADIVASGEGEEQSMSKSLGVASITAMGIGAIIGAGIFVLTGTAAAQYAGPAIMLSFVLAGIACAFVGLCYSELAAMLPVCGSSYTYTYATLGEIFAWIIGWDLVLEYAMGSATVAVGWSGYVVSLLKDAGIVIPAQITAATGTEIKLADGSTGHALFNLPAVLVIVVLTGMLIMGTKESARLNNIMVAVKLTVVLAFVALGAFFIKTANWHPFMPPSENGFGHYGWSGVLRGASVVFYAFIGFDAVSTAAQEAREPQKDMPRGILGAVFVCTVLYVVVAAVLTGLVPFHDLNVSDPVAKGVDAIGYAGFSVFIKIGALVGLTTVILVNLYGQGRIFYMMSHDGLMPGLFSRIHPKLQTPYLSQALIGFCVAIIAALFPITLLSEMVSIGTLLAFVMVCGAVIYLRRSDAEAHRPFRVPGVPLVPLLGIGFCLVLMAGLPILTWARLLVWLAIGLAIYYFYGRRHSVMRGKKSADRIAA